MKERKKRLFMKKKRVHSASMQRYRGAKELRDHSSL